MEFETPKRPKTLGELAEEVIERTQRSPACTTLKPKRGLFSRVVTERTEIDLQGWGRLRVDPQYEYTYAKLIRYKDTKYIFGMERPTEVFYELEILKPLANPKGGGVVNQYPVDPDDPTTENGLITLALTYHLDALTELGW